MSKHLSILAATVAVLLAACTTGTDTAGRLVILNGGDVVTVDSDGANPLTIAADNDGAFFQPVWSPDRSLLAFSLNADEPAMYVADPDGGTTYSIATDSFPFYFSWSSANRLAILRNGEDGLRLDTTFVVNESLEELRTVETGQPLYYSWSPDGLELAAHIGGDQLVLSDLSKSESLGLNPGFFQAPRWTTRGIIALEQGTRDQRLVIVSSDGTSTPVASIGGPATFVTNADGSLIAIQGLSPDQNANTAAFQQLPLLPTNRLVVVTTDSGDQQTVTNQPVLAYFWSPTGDQLLVLDIVAGPQARWSIWTEGELREAVRFEPDPSFITEFVPFFDQYAQSVSLWAPDGSAFAFPGAIDGQPGIWVQPIDGDPRLVSAGTWVSWAP